MDLRIKIKKFIFADKSYALRSVDLMINLSRDMLQLSSE